jgi:hypothetical protein
VTDFKNKNNLEWSFDLLGGAITDRACDDGKSVCYI